MRESHSEAIHGMRIQAGGSRTWKEAQQDMEHVSDCVVRYGMKVFETDVCGKQS